MKKVYLVVPAMDLDDRMVEAWQYVAEARAIPLMPPSMNHYTEEDFIKASVEMIKMSDVVILVGSRPHLQRTIRGRVEIEAAERLGKPIVTNKEALGTWLLMNDTQRRNDELAEELIKKNIGANKTALQRARRILGGSYE
jgi:hypothetical protein